VLGGVEKRRREMLAGLAESHCHLHPDRPAAAIILSALNQAHYACGECARRAAALGYELIGPAGQASG
jgi:hypothetical protein